MNTDPLAALDDHYLGARLTAPLKKPWLDENDNVQIGSSPGAVPSVWVEGLDSWENVQATVEANRAKSLARPINYMDTQVCMGGGLPPCATKIPSYQWEPQHEFRGLRHFICWRRWNHTDDLTLARCAISRIINEPTLLKPPHNQRERGWTLLLAAECVSYLPSMYLDIAAWITKQIDMLWEIKGPNYLCLLTPEQAAASNHLPLVTWQHAILVKALGRLVRRNWPDTRVATLYKIGVLGLDATHWPGTYSWAKDWNPFTGETLAPESVYNGTSLWTVAAYAESLAVITSNSAMRREYIEGFLAQSPALKPTDSNYDAGTHALITACLK